jgi:tRNA (guanine-N7-)-methyltransferase
MKEELLNYQNNQEDRLIRSFGRIKSRKLSDHKKFLLENFLPKFSLQESDLKASKACLEIGFGFGDFLYEKAKNNSDKIFFGVEPHLNGVVNLLAKIEKEPLQNVRISTDDVRIFLQKFPQKFFDEVYILFPDPWPKAKHFKRRLINEKLLDEVLSKVMKSGAKLVIATDHDSYKTWILASILRSKKFSWNAEAKKDWQNFPSDWTVTKYQKKAVAEGRTSVIFNLIHNV